MSICFLTPGSFISTTLAALRFYGSVGTVLAQTD
jgi:hypothetical protein